MKDNYNSRYIKEMINLLEDKRFEELDKYRESIVPKKLYKFMSFNENEKLNKSKIDCIKNNEIWLSSREILNDPFDLNAFYLNEDRIKKYGYPLEVVKNIEGLYKNTFLIGCFTIENNLINSMPMWAHYANNHKGFCIEYNVKKPRCYHPVSYEPERVAMTTICMNLLTLSEKDMNNEITEDEKNKLELYNRYLLLSNTFKHNSWSYENEWRVLFPKKLCKTDDICGSLVSLQGIGLEIKAIYFGINYNPNDENIIELKNICKNLNINTYLMKFDNLSQEYSLTYEKII